MNMPQKDVQLAIDICDAAIALNVLVAEANHKGLRVAITQFDRSDGNQRDQAQVDIRSHEDVHFIVA